MGSLVFYIQRKGICCYNDMKDNFKIILRSLEIHLSIIHPSSSKMTVVAIENVYLTTTTFFLNGVHIVLHFFKVIFIVLGANINACFLKLKKYHRELQLPFL